MKAALVQIVGNDRVSDEENLLLQYSGNFAPSLVVWPTSTEEVAKIVKWANENSVPVVPVSSAGPKIRRSSLPKVKDTLVLDLNKMRKILRIDATNKVAMVEPNGMRAGPICVMP